MFRSTCSRWVARVVGWVAGSGSWAPAAAGRAAAPPAEWRGEMPMQAPVVAVPAPVQDVFFPRVVAELAPFDQLKVSGVESPEAGHPAPQASSHDAAFPIEAVADESFGCRIRACARATLLARPFPHRRDWISGSSSAVHSGQKWAPPVERGRNLAMDRVQGLGQRIKHCSMPCHGKPQVSRIHGQRLRRSLVCMFTFEKRTKP